MAYVYILYSSTLDKYYIGSTTYNPKERLRQHNKLHYQNSFTSKGRPWKIFFLLKYSSKVQALSIERHIKKMKSKIYLRNLKAFPELTNKLLSIYQ